MSLAVYRDLKLRELPRLLYEAGRASATILFLLAAAGPSIRQTPPSVSPM